MKQKTLKAITFAGFFMAAVLFLATFGKTGLLKSYVYTGIGNCHKIPILCMLPAEEIINPAINKEYVTKLLPYSFEDIAIRIPKGFDVIKGEIRRVYYKKWRQYDKGNTVYLLYKKPDFFMGLFPRLKRQGLYNDYDFISRTMYAHPDKIAGVTDTFFVVMKSIFTPDLGDQRNVNMIKVRIGNRSGFISYNLSPKGHYFSCDIIDNKAGYYKVYIKDKAAVLGLDDVFAILSTLNKP